MLLRRKHETLRQFIYRVRDDGLWRDDVSKEGLLVWLDTYESVRFGGVELTETEFLATMKLVYFLLMQMKPPLNQEFSAESMESSSSSSFSLTSDTESFSQTDLPAPTSSPSSRDRTDANVLRQMDSLLTSPRKSADQVSLSSMIDYGSIFEEAIDREERDRRMRGGRLGEREGSVIYYDVED